MNGVYYSSQQKAELTTIERDTMTKSNFPAKPLISRVKFNALYQIFEKTDDTYVAQSCPIKNMHKHYIISSEGLTYKDCECGCGSRVAEVIMPMTHGRSSVVIRFFDADNAIEHIYALP